MRLFVGNYIFLCVSQIARQVYFWISQSKRKVLDLDAVERLLMDDQVAEGVREKYREKGILIE